MNVRAQIGILVCLALGVTAAAATALTQQTQQPQQQQRQPRQQRTQPRTAQPPAPPGAASTAGAEPKTVFAEACGRCHPIERVTASKRSKAQWEETINAMVTSRGAVLTPEQYDVVLKYLVAEYNSEAPAAGQTPAPPTPNTMNVTLRPQPRGGAGPDDKHIVDPAAAQRGRATYAAGCIQCHGTTARGTDRGANIVRSSTLLHDRYGNELGPFLRKGHPTPDDPKSKALTDAQITDLSHFLHERLNDTLRGSPVFTVQNVLTGDKQAGAAYFAGAGGCNKCHSPTGDFAGIGKKYDPPALQGRMLFPRPPGRGPRGGFPGMPVAKPTTVDVTTASGETVSGTLVQMDDFSVSLRDGTGQYRSFKRAAGVTVVKHDPYAAHVALLDTYTDKNIHDVVAYLESLK
jgi:cytochrome c oxidase cbb3-type subunit III